MRAPRPGDIRLGGWKRTTWCVVACSSLLGLDSGAVVRGASASEEGPARVEAPNARDGASASAVTSPLWLTPTEADYRAVGTSRRLAPAVSLHSRGQHAEARRLLSVGRTTEGPLATYAAYYLGHAELQLGELEAARRTFAGLVAHRPIGALAEAAVIGAAEAAEALKDYRAAQQLYQDLLSTPGVSSDRVWLNLARVAASAGERARSREAAHRVYYDFPLSPLAPQAVPLLTPRNAEPIAAGNPRYLAELSRGHRLFDARRYAEARVSFLRVLPHAREADRPVIAVRIAACDYFQRRYADARLRLKPYLNAGSHEAEARFYDLMAARGSGFTTQFVELARTLSARFPSSPFGEEALNELASHYIRRGDHDAAEAVFRRMLETAPDGRFADRAAWKVGWRAYRARRFAHTAPLFEDAARRFPQSDYRPAFLYWASRAREALGDTRVSTEHITLVVTHYRHGYYGDLAERSLAERGTPPLATTTALPVVADTSP